MAELPQFTIVATGPYEVVGSVSSIRHGRHTWVGDRCFGFLLDDERLIEGRWRAHGSLWLFTPENRDDVTRLAAQARWQILDGYWGERAELVFDRKRVWQRRPFGSPDAGHTARPSGVWEHEHCAICWQTIGPGGDAVGYVSAPQEWVCGRCFAEYVQAKSLGFIPCT